MSCYPREATALFSISISRERCMFGEVTCYVPYARRGARLNVVAPIWEELISANYECLFAILTDAVLLGGEVITKMMKKSQPAIGTSNPTMTSIFCQWTWVIYVGKQATRWIPLHKYVYRVWLSIEKLRIYFPWKQARTSLRHRSDLNPASAFSSWV